jgi:hypothetical protein
MLQQVDLSQASINIFLQLSFSYLDYAQMALYDYHTNQGPAHHFFSFLETIYRLERLRKSFISYVTMLGQYCTGQVLD